MSVKELIESVILCLHVGSNTPGKPLTCEFCEPKRELIAAALRAAESSALERAAQECDEHAEYFAAKRIRALSPPAAAPAACPTPYRCRAGHHDLCPAAAPAAETGKAQGAEALLRDCEDALKQALASIDEAFATAPTARIRSCLAKLAARATPPEGEGT